MQLLLLANWQHNAKQKSEHHKTWKDQRRRRQPKHRPTYRPLLRRTRRQPPVHRLLCRRAHNALPHCRHCLTTAMMMSLLLRRMTTTMTMNLLLRRRTTSTTTTTVTQHHHLSCNNKQHRRSTTHLCLPLLKQRQLRRRLPLHTNQKRTIMTKTTPRIKRRSLPLNVARRKPKNAPTNWRRWHVKLKRPKLPKLLVPKKRHNDWRQPNDVAWNKWRWPNNKQLRQPKLKRRVSSKRPNDCARRAKRTKQPLLPPPSKPKLSANELLRHVHVARSLSVKPRRPLLKCALKKRHCNKLLNCELCVKKLQKRQPCVLQLNALLWNKREPIAPN
mmetsp:Transcript_17468/g.30525  ORF Transcript_17468/g.30525 Transcript_17468/m.30525 type:complete len:330 (+) Transcript_17468:1253-2242(+)